MKIFFDNKFKEPIDFLLEKLKSYESKGYIFRGCKDFNYRLIPTIYRDLNFDSDDDLPLEIVDTYNDELKYLIELAHESDDINASIFLNSRHLGLKSALLDFSFSSEVALLFACVDWNTCRVADDKDDSDGIIYVFNPTKFRAINFNDYSLLWHLLFKSEIQPESIGDGKGNIDIDLSSFNYLTFNGSFISNSRSENQKSCLVLFPDVRFGIYEIPRFLAEDVIIIPKSMKKAIAKRLKN